MTKTYESPHRSTYPRLATAFKSSTEFKQGTILGLYLNHPNIQRVTEARIRNPRNLSEYAVEFNGLVRDAFDPETGDISCTVARLNDPLDPNLDNTELFIHPLRPNLLTVRATKDIKDGDFGYLPYGASFWCNSRHSIDTLAKAIRRYNIDIHSSSDSTDGDWKSLPQYSQLSTLFPPPTTTTSRTLLPAPRVQLYPMFMKSAANRQSSQVTDHTTTSAQLTQPYPLSPSDPPREASPTSSPSPSPLPSPTLTRQRLVNCIDISTCLSPDDDHLVPTKEALDASNTVQDLSAYDTERFSPNIYLELAPEGVPASLLVDSNELSLTLPVVTMPDTSTLPPRLPNHRVETSSPNVATSVDTVNTAAQVFDKHLYNS